MLAQHHVNSGEPGLEQRPHDRVPAERDQLDRAPGRPEGGVPPAKGGVGQGEVGQVAHVVR
jgi:hypothetical protein